MKFLGKLLISLLVILLLALVALYIVLQTRWGAGQISARVSQKTSYHLAFDKIEHRWSSPDHLIFKNVTFGRNGQPATLVAQTVDIGLGMRQLSEPQYTDTILLQKGTLNLSPTAIALPLRAARLQFSDMAINRPDSTWDLSAQRVNGGVIPWVPKKGKVLGDKASLEFSAGSLSLNGMSANNVLLQGALDKDQLTLSTIGADIARGSLTGNAHRNADGSWQIGSLHLNDIRLQTKKSLADLLAPAIAMPSLKIDRLEVTDAQLEGKSWALTDLYLSLRDITLAKGGWQSDDGKLAMNAGEFINGSLHLHDPIAKIDFTRQGATLRQFSSHWEGGMVRASGQWLREGSRAVMDEVAIVGLEYTLPGNWKALWMKALPEWLASVTVKKLSANHNLIVDINPNWPFQLTSLDGTANDLQVVRHHQWGIWQGNVSLNAAAATFNRVDIRRPSIALSANQNQLSITELSAFTEKGMLEATATINQTPSRDLEVNLKGQSVPLNVLQQWGWPAPPPEGDGNLQLSVTGRLQAGEPLKPTLSGTLQATSASGQQLHQTMRNGEIAPEE